MLKKLLLSIILTLFCLLPVISSEVEDILRHIDDLREFNKNGFVFDFIIEDLNDVNTEKSVMRVFVNNKSESIAMYTGSDKGKYILLKDKSFWFFDNGMNSPIRISPRQLLLGQASTGDITRIIFTDLYTVDKMEKSDNEYIIHLTAIKGKGATYEKMILFVDKKSLIPIKAETYSKTMVLLKTIRYLEFKEIDGKTMLVKFEILNNNTNEKSLVRLDNFSIDTLPSHYYNKNFMRFLKLE